MTMEHALQRAKERYNVDFEKQDVINICKLCYDKSPLVKRLFVKGTSGLLGLNKYHHLYRVSYKNNIFDVAIVINRKTHKWYLLTFLPKPDNPQQLWINSVVVDKILNKYKE